MARPGIEPRTSDLGVRCPTDCATRPGTSPSERYRTNYGQPKEAKDLVIFLTNQCPAIQIAVPKGKSVNAKFYKGNALHKLKKYFLSRRPATGLRGVRLLHDKAAIVREYLKQGKGCRASAPSLFARSCPL